MKTVTRRPDGSFQDAALTRDGLGQEANHAGRPRSDLRRMHPSQIGSWHQDTPPRPPGKAASRARPTSPPRKGSRIRTRTRHRWSATAVARLHPTAKPSEKGPRTDRPNRSLRSGTHPNTLNPAIQQKSKNHLFNSSITDPVQTSDPVSTPISIYLQTPIFTVMGSTMGMAFELDRMAVPLKHWPLMRSLHLPAICILLIAKTASGQSPDLGASSNGAREWTSSDGKKIIAEFLGVQDQNVMLKLAGDKILPCPISKLSETDQAFLRNHSLSYHANWTGWPRLIPFINVEVSEVPAKDGNFIYTTRKFRFTTDANLGNALMKDLAKVFEATYELQLKAPLGLQASPVDGFYQSDLFGTKQKYNQSGGPPNTSGVYLIKEKRFLAPLELMGVQQGSAGWRRISKADFDSSTIVHELTHMLTHELVENLPLWANEGYAEYISRIPLEGGVFNTSDEGIRSAVVKSLTEYGEGIAVRELTTADIGYAGGGGGGGEKRPKPDPKKMTFPIFPVAKMLTMSSAEWNEPTKDQSKTHVFFKGPSLASKMMWQRYQTAHLILYYYIQIEKSKGVAKLQKMIDQNREHKVKRVQYEEAFKAYQEAFERFKNLPGVTQLPDGKIQYPSNLNPPKAPSAPFADSTQAPNFAIMALLGDESAEVVGARIEDALRKDLGVSLVFVPL